MNLAHFLEHTLVAMLLLCIVYSTLIFNIYIFTGLRLQAAWQHNPPTVQKHALSSNGDSKLPPGVDLSTADLSKIYPGCS